MIQTIGNHKVTCASVEHPIVDEMLAAGPRVRILYSDSPWGDGNMRYWTTLNRKMTGQVVEPLGYTTLLDRIDSLIQRYVTGHVFIETGPRWGDLLLERMSKFLHHVKVHQIDYKAGSKTLPNILVSATTAAEILPHVDLSGVRGAALVRNVVKAIATPGGVVLDPCCGMGYTAMAAIAAGMHFRGNELNAARLAKTIAVLAKKGSSTNG